MIFNVKHVIGDFVVSTIFVDLFFSCDDEYYYETMIFNFDIEKENPFKDFQLRCKDSTTALIQHEEAVKFVKKFLKSEFFRR